MFTANNINILRSISSLTDCFRGTNIVLIIILLISPDCVKFDLQETFSLLKREGFWALYVLSRGWFDHNSILAILQSWNSILAAAEQFPWIKLDQIAAHCELLAISNHFKHFPLQWSLWARPASQCILKEIILDFLFTNYRHTPQLFIFIQHSFFAKLSFSF